MSAPSSSDSPPVLVAADAPAPASAAVTGAAPSTAAAASAPSLPAAFFAVNPAQLDDPSYARNLFEQIAAGNTGEPLYNPPASEREGVLGGGTFASFMPTQPAFVPAPTFGYIPAPQTPAFGFGAGSTQPQQQQPNFFGTGPTQLQQPSAQFAGFGPSPQAQPAQQPQAQATQPFDFSALSRRPGAFASAPTTGLTPASSTAAAAAWLMPSFSFSFPSAGTTGAGAAAATVAPGMVSAPAAPSSFGAPLVTPAVANPFAFVSAPASATCFFCPATLGNPNEACTHLLWKHGFDLHTWAHRMQIAPQEQQQFLRCLRAESDAQPKQSSGASPSLMDTGQVLMAAKNRFQDAQHLAASSPPLGDDALVTWLPGASAPRVFCPFCEQRLEQDSKPTTFFHSHAGHMSQHAGFDLAALVARFHLDVSGAAQVLGHVRAAVLARAFRVPNTAQREAEVVREVEAELEAQAAGSSSSTAQSAPWRQHWYKERLLAEWLLAPPPPMQQPVMTLADFPSSTPSLVVGTNSVQQTGFNFNFSNAARPTRAAAARDAAAALAAATTAAPAPADSAAASALSGFGAPPQAQPRTDWPMFGAAPFLSAAGAASEAASFPAAAAAAAAAAPVPAADDAVCLFCQTRLASAEIAKDHLRSVHSFDLSKFARRFRMSFDQQMQTIHWIRANMDREQPSQADAVLTKLAARYPFPPTESLIFSPGRAVADDLLLVWLPEDGHDGDPAEGDDADGEEEQAAVEGIPTIKTASSFAPLSAFLAAPTAGAAGAEAATPPSAFGGFGLAAQPPPKLADAAAASALSGFAQQQPQPQSQQPPPLVALANIVPFTFSSAPKVKKSKTQPPAAAAAGAGAPAAAVAVPVSAMSNGNIPMSMFGRVREPLPPVVETLQSKPAPLSFLGPPSAAVFEFPKVAVTDPAPAPSFSFVSSLAAVPSSAAAPLVDANVLFPSSERPRMEKAGQQQSKLKATIYVAKKIEPVAAAAGPESKEDVEANAAAAPALAFSFGPARPKAAATAAATAITPFSFQPPVAWADAAKAPRTLAEIAPVDSSPEELASNDALSHVFRFLDLRTMHTVMSVAHRWRTIVSHMRSMQFVCTSLPLLWRLLPSQRHRLGPNAFFSSLDFFHPLDPKTLPLSALAKRHLGSVDLTMVDPKSPPPIRGTETVTAEIMDDFAIALPQLRRLTCAVASDGRRLVWPRALEYLNLSIHTNEDTTICPDMLGSLSELTHLHEVRMRVVRSGWMLQEQFGEQQQNVVPGAALQALPACVRTLLLHGELSAEQVAVIRRRLPNLVSLTVDPPQMPPYFLTSLMLESYAKVATRISAQITALVAEPSDHSVVAEERERPPQLQELHVVQAWSAALSQALARVKTLTTLTCIDVGAQANLDLLSSLRSLRTLSVSFSLGADADALVVALSYAPQLTSLRLDGHQQLRPAHLGSVLSTHLQLQSLTLRSLPLVESMAFFAECNPPPAALAAVSLCYLGVAAYDDVIPLLSLPALRSLRLVCPRLVSPHRSDLFDLRQKGVLVQSHMSE